MNSATAASAYQCTGTFYTLASTCVVVTATFPGYSGMGMGLGLILFVGIVAMDVDRCVDRRLSAVGGYSRQAQVRSSLGC